MYINEIYVCLFRSSSWEILGNFAALLCRICCFCYPTQCQHIQQEAWRRLALLKLVFDSPEHAQSFCNFPVNIFHVFRPAQTLVDDQTQIFVRTLFFKRILIDNWYIVLLNHITAIEPNYLLHWLTQISTSKYLGLTCVNLSSLWDGKDRRSVQSVGL